MSRPKLAASTIMMVDDEPTTLDVLEMFLEAAGYEDIVSVTDSHRVLALLATRRPDALLLNLMMPGVDGFDILRAMRAEPALASIPVIVLTSSTDPETKRRALELGAAEFLAKPVDPSELALRLRNTLAASSHRRGTARAPARRQGAPATPGAPASSQPPLISRLAGDGPRVRRILAEFAVRLAEKLAAMDASLEVEDRASLADLAHWLKGAAGTVGFDAFTAPAEEVRGLAGRGSRQDIAAKLRELHQLAARIVVEAAESEARERGSDADAPASAALHGERR